MKRLLFLVTFALFVVSCGKEPVPYFVQISDPQLGFINFSEDFSPEVGIMEKMINRVNLLEPDFIVLSGDLVHKRTDSCALEAFKVLLSKFRKDIKVYCLPGNHDVGNDASAEDVHAFVERYGSDRFVHKEDAYTVIGYNSCVVKAQTPAEEDEYKWLEDQLKNADGSNPIIVVAHHPIFLNSPDEPDSYETFPQIMRIKYLQLFEKYGVDTYLAGHLHKNARAEYNGIELVTSSAAGRQLGNDEHGYSIIRIGDGRPMLEYRGISAPDYAKGEFVAHATGDTLLYRYLVPENLKKGQKYPLVIFLHGSGERGSDNKAQLFHGSGQFLNPVNREKYPAYVLFPQCPEGVSGAYKPRLETLVPADMPMNPPVSPMVITLMELIDHYISMPEVDPKRVYIMGISMGGIATFDIVSRYPEKFAAAVPICGSVNPYRLKNTEGVAWRLYHGDADAAVPVEGSREAYKALKRYGMDVEYIEFPGCTHNSWNPAFNSSDFMEWLFEQKR